MAPVTSGYMLSVSLADVAAETEANGSIAHSALKPQVTTSTYSRHLSLVATASGQHAEGLQLDPGQVYITFLAKGPQSAVLF